MDGGKVSAVLQPEQRFYPAEGQDMSDTAIRTTGLRDLYLALGDDRGNGRFAFRAYVSPLAPLIWLGGAGDGAGRHAQPVGPAARARARAQAGGAAQALAAE